MTYELHNVTDAIPDEEPIGHLCLYIDTLEIHTDLWISGGGSVEALADGLVTLVRNTVMEHFNAETFGTSVQ